MSSITINGLPVLLDWQFQLRNFLDARLPTSDMLFARWTQPVNTNPLTCGNAPEYLHPPYPQLPPIKIGEVQWPTGASRYARALYAVDWVTLCAIMKHCFDYQPPMSDDTPPVELKPFDVPARWDNVFLPGRKHVVVEISGDKDGYFRCNMIPLSAHRVTGNGVDLWLLPLVDSRFFRNVFDVEMEDTDDWDWLLFQLASEQRQFVGDMSGLGLYMPIHDYADDSTQDVYGKPDPRLLKPEQPQYAAQLLDVAALSVGLRTVVNPMTDRAYLMGSYASYQVRIANLGIKPHIAGEVSVAVYQVGGIYPYYYLPRLTSLGDSGNFSATGLPAGLQIDPSTGLISGSFPATAGTVGGPTQSGVFSITVSRGGLSYSFTLVVVDENELEVPAETADGDMPSARLIAGSKTPTTTPVDYIVYCLRDGKPTKHGGNSRNTFPVWTTWEDRLDDEDPPLLPDGRVGVPYSYTPTVGTSGSYSATGLPAGLSIHATTGVISGTPTTSGTFTATITRGGSTATLTIEIGESHSEVTDAFVQAVRNDFEVWSNSGGQYCFAGPISYEPTGYDDFCSIDLFEIQPGEYVFRSRVYELPPYFGPSVVLAGGEEPACSRSSELYRFEMTEDIESGDGGETGESTIILNYPKNETISEKAILVNVDGMIDGARSGFKGQCKYESGKYWFVQGACGQICKSSIFIPKQTPTNARIGQTDYSWTPTVDGSPNAGSFDVEGLPDDWSFDADTGEIIGPVTGVLGPERYIDVKISASGPKTPPGEGNCTSTRKVKIRVVGA